MRIFELAIVFKANGCASFRNIVFHHAFVRPYTGSFLFRFSLSSPGRLFSTHTHSHRVRTASRAAPTRAPTAPPRLRPTAFAASSRRRPAPCTRGCRTQRPCLAAISGARIPQKWADWVESRHPTIRSSHHSFFANDKNKSDRVSEIFDLCLKSKVETNIVFPSAF